MHCDCYLARGTHAVHTCRRVIRAHSKYFAAILLLSVTYASLSRYASRNMRNMSTAKMAVRQYSITPAVSVNGLQERAKSEKGQPSEGKGVAAALTR